MMKILIVDDEDGVLQAVAEHFRSLGHTVFTAPNGSVALDSLEDLEALASPAVDVILSDLEMPGLGGEALLSAVRKHPALKVVPLAIMSANLTPETVRRLATAGADGVICKPFQLTVLTREVEAARSRREEHELEKIIGRVGKLGG